MEYTIENVIALIILALFFGLMIGVSIGVKVNNTKAYTCTPKVIEVEHTEVKYAPCVCPEITNDCYDEVLDRIDGVNAFKSQIEVRK